MRGGVVHARMWLRLWNKEKIMFPQKKSPLLNGDFSIFKAPQKTMDISFALWYTTVEAAWCPF